MPGVRAIMLQVTQIFVKLQFRLQYSSQKLNRAHVSGVENMNIHEDYECDNPVSLRSDVEDDFEQTMALIDMDIEEVQITVEHSLEEVCS